ncbi:MAG: M20 family metallopeptidase [Peptostreptococcaceae bacterium]
MKSNIKEKIDSLKNEIVDDVVESIKIPSVIADEVNGFPFGEEIDKSLRQTLKLCEDLGFKTVYKDGYYGYAEVGQGEELIGILCHLDVVPEGDVNEWTFPPFSGTIHENKIYGRGTQDDKAPTIASIYAVKSLMDLGIEFNKRVRIIFGTDEENLWRCINKYVKEEEMPSMGFAPDAVFPLINAEKGLLQVKLTSSQKTDLRLNVGNSFNSVPDNASYFGNQLKELKNELDKLNFEYIENSDSINVRGCAYHSQSCDKDEAINAISRLAIALNNIGVNSDTMKFIAEVIGEDANANNVLLNCQDDVSGKLTFNIGKLIIDESSQTICVDIRYPVTLEKEVLVNALTKKANEYNLEYNEYDFIDSIYVPEDNFLVETLLKVYREETNDFSKPLSSGGATYARALNNCVAFGATFKTTKKTAHQKDEHIDIDELIKATEIYALSIFELIK